VPGTQNYPWRKEGKAETDKSLIYDKAREVVPKEETCLLNTF
jgi:hypothetical protein